jgi:hypothetical protein
MLQERVLSHSLVTDGQWNGSIASVFVQSAAAVHPLVFLSFGNGFLWIAADWLPPGHIPTGFKLWHSLIGLIPIAFALIVAVRRIWVELDLLLDNDGMILPIGCFRCGRQRSSTQASGASGGN